VTSIRLRYIHRFKDRFGKVRHYLRAPGVAKRVALPGAPGSPEFMAAYAAAIAALPTKPDAGADRTVPGSLDALAVAWYRSAPFRQLGPSTQGVYRGILDRLRAKHGTKPVRLMEPRHVRALVAEKAETPAAANHVLRIMRLLMRFAIEEGWRQDDPTRDVRRLKEKGEGIPTWSEADIAAFEAKWPVGTRERLALALLVFTGQRRSDVVRMGRQHLRGEAIEVRQVKTGARLVIPIHPDLRAALGAVPEGQLTFLLTGQGKAFTPAGFAQRFKDWSAEAGVPAGRSPHGLRKAAARRLAEAGCSAHQIAAVTGHKTLAEVERYTRAVDQAKLAEAAIARIGKGGS
jgi:integrase